MKYQTKTFLPAILMVLCAAIGFTGSVQAQDSKESKASQRSSSGGRDPFRKYEPPRPVVKKSGLIVPPSVQERIEQYKAQKIAAMNAHIAAPKPTIAFLLNEIQVVGISRSPRGYAAIVEASPIKLAYVIYPGERFYDGQLVAIEDNRLIFRRETVFADGRRERSVEMKPLRQPSTVEALAAVKSQPSQAAAADEKKSEKPTADKP
ncbi:MAG TPA: hypothetical protein VJT50_12005 [Pyrinomonadaceae bacterium]|nr:hypothetical protein [Pyrinomonadaceae bacterium]